jgi:hypothetical protein
VRPLALVIAVAAIAAAGCGDNLAATAHVRVTREDTEGGPGVPVPGARIAVTGAAGVALYTTDADGEAALAIAEPATVIVARDDGAVRRLYVIDGVAADQRVELGARPAPAGSEAGLLTVHFVPYPGGPWLYDSDFYPCSNGGTSAGADAIEIDTFTGCAPDARTLTVAAEDPGTLAPVAFAAVPEVAAVPGERTAGAWEPGVDYRVDVTGAPAIATEAYTELAFAGAWRVVIASGPLADGAGSAVRRDATLAGPARATTRIATSGSAPQYLATPDAALPALAVDAGALLPFIADVAFDAPGRALAWREAVPGAAPAIVTALFTYADPVSGDTYEWTLYAPASTPGRLAIPAIPDELTTHDLGAGPIGLRDLWLVGVDGASYADLLEDLDLDRTLLDGDGYRPAQRSLASGGEVL